MRGNYPFAYRDLAEWYGPPSSVEETRANWSRVVKDAETGISITLIAPRGPGRGGWAAVVPLSEVPDSGLRCPAWPLSEARAKLGDVIDAATEFRAPVPQILSRHQAPTAAVIAALALDGLTDGADRIDVQALIEEGGQVSVEGDPAPVPDEYEVGIPVNTVFTATAYDRDSVAVGSGAGPTITAAMLRVRRLAGFPDQPDRRPYSNEPPF